MRKLEYWSQYWTKPNKTFAMNRVHIVLSYTHTNTYVCLKKSIKFPLIISAEINQGRKLLTFKRFWPRKVFKGGKYSRAETIRGNTVNVLWKFPKIYSPSVVSNENMPFFTRSLLKRLISQLKAPWFLTSVRLKGKQGYWILMQM